MLKKKENKFLHIPRKTTQADIILLCNSDGAADGDTAFLKEFCGILRGSRMKETANSRRKKPQSY